METRQREDGNWISNCIACNHIEDIGHNSFECNSPRTGYHRYDTLHMGEGGKVQFPEWCPLFKKDVE